MSSLFEYYVPKNVSAFANNNEGLLFAVIGIDVFQRCGDQLFRKFGRQPDWKRHTSFKYRISHRTIFVIIIVISNLKGAKKEGCELEYAGSQL